MAKKKAVSEAVKPAMGSVSAAPGLFVLLKNHGLTLHGRTHMFYAAGTTFDPVKDGEVISHLARSGAIIEQVSEGSTAAEESIDLNGGDPEGLESSESGEQSEKQE